MTSEKVNREIGEKKKKILFFNMLRRCRAYCLTEKKKTKKEKEEAEKYWRSVRRSW